MVLKFFKSLTFDLVNSAETLHTVQRLKPHFNAFTLKCTQHLPPKKPHKHTIPTPHPHNTHIHIYTHIHPHIHPCSTYPPLFLLLTLCLSSDYHVIHSTSNRVGTEVTAHSDGLLMWPVMEVLLYVL